MEYSKRNYSKNNYDFNDNCDKFTLMMGRTNNEEKITDSKKQPNKRVHTSFNFRSLKEQDNKIIKRQKS